MNWFGNFIVSRASGWIAVVVTIALAGSIIWIKDLQQEAAYCKGQLDAAKSVKALENRVVDAIKRDTKDVIKDVEQIKEDAEDVIEERPEPAPDEIIPPSGCAAERAPDSVLRYHGWLRD